MGQPCPDSHVAATNDEARNEHLYLSEIKNSVASIIGYKSQARVKKARSALKVAQGQGKRVEIAKRKLQLKIQEAKHEAHSALYDKLVDYIYESGKVVNFDKTIVDPKRVMDDWRDIFSKRLRGEISPLTVQQGRYTIQALSKLVDRIVTK